MTERRIGIIIIGATGRMGATQHVANLLAIVADGGLVLGNAIVTHSRRGIWRVSIAQSSEPGRNVEQCHRSGGPQQSQRLQRDHCEQNRLRHAGDNEQAQEDRHRAARRGADNRGR